MFYKDLNFFITVLASISTGSILKPNPRSIFTSIRSFAPIIVNKLGLEFKTVGYAIEALYQTVGVSKLEVERTPWI